MKIEKGIPIPDARPSYARYPFGDMEKGDSVFIKGVGHRGKEVDAAKKIARRKGRKFSVRIEGDGIRIWRTA